MRPATRVVALVLLVLYGAGLVAVLTEYNPTVAVDVVGRVSDWATARGMPASMSTPERVEFGLNALMFSPAVLLVSVALPQHPWANWVVYAFVGSGLVELWQGLFLPPRSAQMVDVVANTLGGLLGAVLAMPITRILAEPSRETVSSRDRGVDHRS